MQTNTPNSATGRAVESNEPGTGKGDLADQAKQAASNVAGQAKEQVSRGITSQKEMAAGSLGTVAHALRRASQDLRDRGELGVAVEQIAERIDRTSRYVEGRTIGELVEDVERFARREPVLFLGGAFVAGVAAARFAKSSQRAERETSERAPRAIAAPPEGRAIIEERR